MTIEHMHGVVPSPAFRDKIWAAITRRERKRKLSPELAQAARKLSREESFDQVEDAEAAADHCVMLARLRAQRRR